MKQKIISKIAKTKWMSNDETKSESIEKIDKLHGSLLGSNIFFNYTFLQQRYNGVCKYQFRVQFILTGCLIFETWKPRIKTYITLHFRLQWGRIISQMSWPCLLIFVKTFITSSMLLSIELLTLGILFRFRLPLTPSTYSNSTVLVRFAWCKKIYYLK